MSQAFDPYRALQAAEQGARAAGAHLQASRSRLSAALVTRQQPLDVAEAIEQEAARLIRDVVQRRFPAFGVLSARQPAASHQTREEGQGNSGTAGRVLESDRDALPDGDRPTWIIAALDGCANYVRGHAQYAVAVALVCGGEPQLGVVFDPCRNEVFRALRGRGAQLNGERIRCSVRREPQQALAATVFPRPASPRMAPYMGELGRVQRAMGGLRRSGSSALELAYLAAGRIDAFWEHDADASDTAAGALLVYEAGAQIEARDGQPLLASRSLMASTPAVRDTFHALLAEA